MKSLWQAGIKPPSFPSLTEDLKTHILIIGGGIAGILTAYMLHQNDAPYILVEKNKICCGTTENTTAKITFQHGLIYSKILKMYGQDTAQKYFHANKTAFHKYEELCKNINCDFEYKNNFVYSTDNCTKIENEIVSLRKLGYNSPFFGHLPLPLSIEGALCFENQAQFHPLKFINGIVSKLNIFENTFVREINNHTATTNFGKIQADKIVVATHFPFINKHGNYFLKQYQHRSYVIALENAQNVQGMYVDENKKGLSFRNYNNLLLLGGEGHRTGKKGGNWDELRIFKAEKYPGSTEVQHWATQDCMSLDSIPYIGKYSTHTPHMYVATGFNKWGMTGAMVSATILCDILMGIKNDYADAFSPSRSILKPQLLVNGFEATKNLLTLTKPRCTHLGCALKWNKREHSWDCPCHGSRFSQKGTILDNPANNNLDV